MSESDPDTDNESRDDLGSLMERSGSEEGRPDQPEIHPLTIEILSECLSLLCKTGNGLAHAYVRVDLKDRGLTDINALRPFIHLRYLDVSMNFLRDLSSLTNLSHLLWLCADENYLTSAYIEDLPFLQVASMAKNRIRDTEGIGHPLLESLNLIENQIREVSGLDPNKLTRLHTLELRGNMLESTEGINLPNLQNLYLAGNSINRLEGLEVLTGLRTLHLRDNHLESLQGFSASMASLQYINFRGNLIVKIQEMKHLQCLPALRALIIAENPCTEEESYRLETLLLLRKLERLDKEGFSTDDRLEAEEIHKQREAEQKEKEANERDESSDLHS
ncbi:leucine-rich repeat-containing protein 23 [Scyliorhinus torazame]|uniref:leucine-rich repeat-containing protein 23 n=1 Tax=Scyliorhinus torazame TaxID=75743 RepID=UPI003B5AE7B4